MRTVAEFRIEHSQRLDADVDAWVRPDGHTLRLVLAIAKAARARGRRRNHRRAPPAAAADLQELR
ncbi:MAG TPA: hypothetical protein VMU86_04305 [Steroidobacteraceae bacterium]|nr:hypothetical protein [Steroidobacteraceae bacterium]